MNRNEKATEIASLKDKFAKSQLTILADNKGLTVANLTNLRGKLRQNQASLKVVKNRLAKIAVKETPSEPLTQYLTGATTVTFALGDPSTSAKVVTEFAKDNEKFAVKAGLLNGKLLNLADLKALASLPSKEELIAKMLGSLNAPATNLVSVLSQIPRQLVTVLAAIRDQKSQ